MWGTRSPDTQSALSEQQETIRRLHDRIAKGDDKALEELSRELLQFLIRCLRSAYRRASIDLVTDACEDAILEYGAQPDRFDSTRGVPLDRFLYASAARNVANLLESDRRRLSRETRYAEYSSAATMPTFAAVGDKAETRRGILSVADDGPERKALVEWLEGERRVTVLAAILGLSDLPRLEQRREVKRFKDRILKRVSRQFENSHRRK